MNSLVLHANEPKNNIEELQRMSINMSNLIFLGELVSSDSLAKTATYRIFEKYKGNYSLDTICVKNSMEEYIGFHHYKGLWLVYLVKASDSSYHFCRGYLSRSLEHPEDLFIWTYIEKIVNKEYGRNNLRIDAMSDWFLELEKLRRLNKSKILVKENSNSRMLIILLVIFSSVNFLLLIYFLIKKNARR
jgi:hypothetical protein